MSVPPSRPVSLKPASIGMIASSGTGSTSSTSFRPIRREKNGSVVDCVPKAKIWERCRKKRRFSGKKSEVRPKLNCWACDSASSKSMLTVTSASVEEDSP